MADRQAASEGEGTGKFRVLALDGGGARALVSALQLERMEEILNAGQDSPVPLGRRFDLIAGTSSGAILAAGLALDIPAAELRELFEQTMEAVFSRPSKGLFQPLYRNDALRRVLEERFGDATLVDVETDVCLVTVEVRNGTAHLYKSDYREEYTQREKERLADVVLASTAAPVYFPLVGPLRYSGILTDGSLCANNPAMVALVDAMRFERPSRSRGVSPPGQRLDRIVLLSVGTGESDNLSLDVDSLRRGGAHKWIAPWIDVPDFWNTKRSIPLIEVMLKAQTQITEGYVRYLLPKENYLRLNASGLADYAIDDVANVRLHARGLADLSEAERDWILAHLA